MKRTSVVAPLLLIGVGLLFLAHNLYPDLPLLDYLARYWPWLLVVWGILRLAEILFWAATEKPLPRRGLAGGEWALVIILCILGGSLDAVRGSSQWWARNRISIGGLEMFGENYDYPLQGEKACSKNPRIVIESFRGNARITGGDESSVKVTGHRSIRSLEQSSADRANTEASFELAGDVNQVVVRTNEDKVAGDHRISEDLELSVPRGATVEAHGRYGDFDVSNVDGDIEITSDNAGVRLENIGGSVRVDLSRSDIVRANGVKGTFDLKGHGEDIDLSNISGQVTVNGSYTGTIQLASLSQPLHMSLAQTTFNVEKIPGQVRMTLGDFNASDLVGPIRLDTRSHDVQIAGFTNTLDVTVERGDIELRPGHIPLSRIDAHTRSGNVELAIPAGSKFDLTASTNRGEITNDYGSPLRSDDQGRGARLTGSMGDGPSIKVSTDHGQVVVRKAAQGEESPSASSSPPSKPQPLKKVEQ